MNAIHAIWKDGRIIPAQPIDWPDGTPLTVEPLEAPRDDEPEVDLLGNDPASIARWIAEYNALPPLQMTDAEEAEWQGGAASNEGTYHRRDVEVVHRGTAVSRYLLDTNAAADAMFHRRGVPERVTAARAAGHDIGIGIPVLGELYAGAEFRRRVTTTSRSFTAR